MAHSSLFYDCSAFRQLFGYQANLSLSIMTPTQLSLSLGPISPLSMAHLSLSLGAGMSFGMVGIDLPPYMYPTEVSTSSSSSAGNKWKEEGIDATTVSEPAGLEESEAEADTSSVPKGVRRGPVAATVGAVATLAVFAAAAKYRKNYSSFSGSVSVASADTMQQQQTGTIV